MNLENPIFLIHFVEKNFSYNPFFIKKNMADFYLEIFSAKLRFSKMATKIWQTPSLDLNCKIHRVHVRIAKKHVEVGSVVLKV